MQYPKTKIKFYLEQSDSTKEMESNRYASEDKAEKILIISEDWAILW